MFIKLFYSMLVMLVLVSCYVNPSMNEQPITLMPTATIPPDVNPRDIYVDQNSLELIRNLGKQHSGGISASIKATYDEQFAESYSSFHVESEMPFLGQGWVWNADASPHNFAILCLLDYYQIPCAPSTNLVTIKTLTANQEHFFPIEMPLLEYGLHDLGLILIRDPYLGIQMTDLSERSETLSVFANHNVYVENSVEIPQIETFFPEPRDGLTDYSSLFYVSKNPDLLERNGLIEVWLLESSYPGEMVDLYFHFNDTEDLNADMIVVMAFINYEQVPILYENQPYFPFYIERTPVTWQTLPVQIRAPEQPGVYEIWFMGVSYPFHPLEINGESVGKFYAEDSQRIRLEVIP